MEGRVRGIRSLQSKLKVISQLNYSPALPYQFLPSQNPTPTRLGGQNKKWSPVGENAVPAEKRLSSWQVERNLIYWCSLCAKISANVGGFNTNFIQREKTNMPSQIVFTVPCMASTQLLMGWTHCSVKRVNTALQIVLLNSVHAIIHHPKIIYQLY